MDNASTDRPVGSINDAAVIGRLATILRLFAAILCGYLALQILVWFYRPETMGPGTLWKAAAVLKLALICATGVGLERAWRLAGKSSAHY